MWYYAKRALDYVKYSVRFFLQLVVSILGAILILIIYSEVLKYEAMDAPEDEDADDEEDM